MSKPLDRVSGTQALQRTFFHFSNSSNVTPCLHLSQESTERQKEDSNKHYPFKKAAGGELSWSCQCKQIDRAALPTKKQSAIQWRKASKGDVQQL